MSIYNEESTLFMDKDLRDSYIKESDIKIIPGYTSTIDLFKVIEESIQNDMLLFETVYNFECKEIYIENSLSEATTLQEKNDANEEKNNVLAEKASKLKELLISAIEKVSAAWASILDSVAKGLEAVYRKIKNEKSFKTNKAEFLSRSYDNFTPNGENFYDIDFSTILVFFKDLNDAVNDLNAEKIDRVVAKVMADPEKIEKVIIDSFVPNACFDTFSELSEKYFKLEKVKKIKIDTDEIVKNIEDSKDSIKDLHKIKNKVFTNLRSLKRTLPSKYNSESESDINNLNTANQVVNKIRELFSMYFSFIFKAKKTCILQSYTLFSQCLRYNEDSANHESYIMSTDEMKIIDMINDI